MDFCKEYLGLITGEFKGINLTRILDYEEFKLKQYRDSIYPFSEIDLIQNIFKKFDNIVDVGFGGGFPILPLAELFPHKNFYGFEARLKKVNVVSEIAERMNIKNVKLNHIRIENIAFDKSVLITIKAVGKIEDLLKKIYPVSDVTVCFFKGPEVEHLENTNIKNWDLVCKESYNLDKSTNRTIYIYKNKAVLRGTPDHDFEYFSNI